MVIVRSPLRITLGGGGTDLPSWYESEGGGFLISAAIDKYIYLTGAYRSFDKKIWLSYSKVELCDSVSEVQHELYAKCLAKYNLANGIEIHSISEVPGKTGLGSSGSFLVGLIFLLNIMYKREMKLKEISELACTIEMKELKKSSGKQDPYVAAHGNIVTMDISDNGEVDISHLELDQITRKSLKNNLLIYYSGISRSAESVLKVQRRNLETKNKKSVSNMKRIMEIGLESKECLLTGRIDDFGRLLNEHWQVKKGISNKMSSSDIDEIYDFAIRYGALGGKILGAGGGGFFLFYVPPERQFEFRNKMNDHKLIEMEWDFDLFGVTKIFMG